MSTTIDNKVVELSFDNSGFESGVKQSISTLDKLKQALTFKGATKGFEEIDSASRKLSFSGLSDSLENVKVQFSALEVAAITALTNITNRAVNAGIQFAKSLSVDQITAGFSKYEQKTTAVQTIMSATTSTWKKNADEIERANYLVENGYFTEEVARNIAKAYDAVASGDMTLKEASQTFDVFTKDVEDFSDALAGLNHEGSQMEFIDEQLNKLNWFSDETSFSFSDMTNNIGKFTANGVQLTDAVEAMEGISVWAAKSGAGINEASRAMYNLSQAMAVGSVKLIDWKSIENANMATQEFKQTAIDTALAMGTLEETTEKGVYHVVGAAKEATVSVTNFNENLQKGWFSSDVLMKTLSTYGKATTLLSDVYDKYDTTATNFLSHLDDINDGSKTIEQAAKELGIPVQELTGYVEKLNSEEYALGLASFRMAQEAKTFTEAIEATKDAVSTGWMKTFEYIFGNYEEAKSFWTDLTNGLWDVFAASGETRNAILRLWKEKGGRDSFIDAFWNLWDAISSVTESIRKGFEVMFPNDVFAKARNLLVYTNKLRWITKDLLDLAEANGDKITNTFTGIASILKIIKNTVTAVLKGFKPLFTALSGTGSSILDLTSDFGLFMKNVSDSAERLGVFEKITEKVGKVVAAVAKIISNAFTYLTYAIYETGEGFNASHIFEFLKEMVTFTIPTTLIDSILTLFEALTGKDLSEQKSNVFTFFRKFSNRISEFIDFMKEVPSKLSNIFEKITGLKPGEAFNKIKDAASGAIDKIKEFFSELKNIDFSGVDKFKSDAEKKFEPLTSIFNGLGKAFGVLWEILKKVAPVFIVLGTIIGDALGSLADTIHEKLQGLEINVETVSDLLSSGGLFALGLGINKVFTKDKNKGFGGFAEILEKITGIFDGVKESLEAWQNSIKANTILKIAAAIGIVALSLISLAAVDSNRLKAALVVLGAGMAEIFAMFKGTTALSVGDNVKGTATAMLEMAGAVYILALAMEKLAKLDGDKLFAGLMAITGLMGVMVGVVKILGTNEKKMVSGGGAMILFAFALNLLVRPVEKLGNIPWDNLKNGLLAVGTLMGTIVAFVKILNQSKFGIGTAFSIILLAGGINLLVKPIEKLGSMDVDQLEQGLLTFAGLLGLIDIFANTLGENSKRLFSASVGMILIGVAMTILSGALAKLGEIPFDNLMTALAGMGLALMEMIVTIEMLPKDVMAKAIGLLFAAGAMIALGNALQAFGGMSWEDIARGLVAMGGALLELSIALFAMQGSIGGAAALVVAALGLAILAPVLKSLGKMSWEEMGKSLLMLAGTFVVLAAAGLLLTPLVVPLLGIGAAVALLGVGVAALGAGVVFLSAGLAMLAVTGTAGIAVLTLALEAIIGLIPSLAKAVGQGLIEIVKVIGESIPIILETVTKIIVAILDALTTAIPKIVDFLILLLEELGRLLPTLIEFILQFIEDLLKGIDEHIADIIYELVMIVGHVIEGLIRAIPDFIVTIADALGDAIPDLLTRLGDSLVEHAPEIRDSIIYLGKCMIKAFCEFFGIESPSKEFAELGKYLIEGLINGIKNMIESIVDTIRKIFTRVKEFIQEKFADFKAWGFNLINNMKQGIENMKENVKEAFATIINAVKDKITGFFNDFVNIGKNLVQGFIDGIFGKKAEAEAAGSALGGAATAGAQKGLGIKSPSKVFRQIGHYVDEGLVLGLQDYTSRVEDASSQVGDSAVYAMQTTLEKLSDSMNEELDANPTITPVLDLSEIQNGSSMLDSMFADQRMGLAFASDGFNSNRSFDLNAENNDFMRNTMTEVFARFVPEIVNAINSSAANQQITFDFTPNTRRFYKEMRVENQRFERSNGYNGMI